MMNNEACASQMSPGEWQALALRPEFLLEFLHRVLKNVDPRLAEHERQAAFMVFSMADVHGGIGPAKLRELFLLAFLHDLGVLLASDELETIFEDECRVPARHAVYGYLLFREMLPGRLAEVVRYHHTPYCEMVRCVPPEIALYAQMLHLADRVAVLASHHGRSTTELDTFITACGAEVFSKDVARLFRWADFTHDICHKVKSEIYLLEGQERNYFPEPAELEGCLRLLAFLGDGKNGRPPVATAVRVAAANKMAVLWGLENETTAQLHYAAMLMDIKRLDARAQGVYTRRELLDGFAQRELLELLELADRWQEGKGPPSSAALCEGQKGAAVLALATLVGQQYETESYPEADGVLNVIKEEGEKGRQCKEVVQLFAQHAPAILAACTTASEWALARRGNIRAGAETSGGLEV